MLGCLFWQRLAVNSYYAGSNHQELNLSCNLRLNVLLEASCRGPCFQQTKSRAGACRPYRAPVCGESYRMMTKEGMRGSVVTLVCAGKRRRRLMSAPTLT